MGGSLGTATDIVIFGASGDLTRRKILPALRGVEDSVRILGAGRSAMSREQFQRLVAESSGSADLAARSDWIHLDYDAADSYRTLREAVNGDGRPVVYYLASTTWPRPPAPSPPSCRG
jgi:glucose-6-phosphate 1-dehydrogenase